MFLEASATGKVLLTGGYLILDQKYSGLVLATEKARFYTKVSINDPTSSLVCQITVHLEQFNTILSYTLRITKDTFQLEVNEPSDKNRFLQCTILFTLAVVYRLLQRLPASLTLFTRASNDFYSQRAYLHQNHLSPTRASLAQLSDCHSFDHGLADAHKTGLGSSAALVVSCTAALYYALVGNQNKEWIHTLSQWAHAVAQCKLGSGFDVCCAVYGSCIYSRGASLPLCHELQVLLDATIQNHCSVPVNLLDAAWTALTSQEVGTFSAVVKEKVNWPPGLQVILYDVNGGSVSPKLVSLVLAWRHQNPIEAEEMYLKLSLDHQRIVQLLTDLFMVAQENELIYFDTIRTLSAIPTRQWSPRSPIEILFHQLSVAFQEYRQHLTEMGELANVPIISKVQSVRLDQCLAIPGCLGALVPGAGGEDAFCCLIFDLDHVRSQLDSVCDENVTPLLTGIAIQGGIQFQ